MKSVCCDGPTCHSSRHTRARTNTKERAQARAHISPAQNYWRINGTGMDQQHATCDAPSRPHSRGLAARARPALRIHLGPPPAPAPAGVSQHSLACIVRHVIGHDLVHQGHQVVHRQVGAAPLLILLANLACRAGGATRWARVLARVATCSLRQARHRSEGVLPCHCCPHTDVSPRSRPPPVGRPAARVPAR